MQIRSMGSGKGRARVDADAVRSLREGYPLTIRELSSLSGVSLSTISGIENSHRSANPSTVRKLASVFGVEPHELMTKVDQ